MEDIIQRLVKVDLECAARVEEAKKRKLDAQKDMKEKKEEIYKTFMQEQINIMEEHKAKLQKQNKQKQEADEKQFVMIKQQLESLYNTNKDEWVAQIVERCLR